MANWIMFTILTVLTIFIAGITTAQDVQIRLAYPCVYCMPLNQPAITVGEWAPWSEWSICSDSFGVTSQTRRRTCFNGNQCPGGDAEEARQCLAVARDSPLPIQNIQPTQLTQPTWTEWGSWSQCNGSNQSRTRGCKCDKAINLEQCNCAGESFQEQPCAQTLPVIEPCTTCQSNICSECPPNYPLPCYTCVGIHVPGKL